MTKEERKAYDKAYREANKEERKAYNKAYREANKEEQKAYDKAYREANKEERKASSKAYYEANKEAHKAYNEAHKEQQKDAALRRKYNITLADYKCMVKAQGGRCKICGKKKPLHVDHCHKRHKVRGLLCHMCNTRLGLAFDSARILRSALVYLKAAGSDKMTNEKKTYKKTYREAHKEDIKASSKAYNEAHKEEQKDTTLRRRYNITLADYKCMVKAQGSRCKICGKKKPLHVDHCHKRHQVRGLLCRECNLLLAGEFNTIRIIEAAIKYLEV